MGFSQAGTLAGAIAAAYGYGDAAAAGQDGKYSAERQHKFGLLAARLDALSPLTVLARGYSITKTDSGRALRSIADVRWGEELRTQVADGDVISVVQQVERREKQ